MLDSGVFSNGSASCFAVCTRQSCVALALHASALLWAQAATHHHWLTRALLVCLLVVCLRICLPGHPCSWYLTRLELGRHAGFSSSFAIEQLTRLRHLTLFEDSADVLLPCVASLPSLTRLALVDVAAASLPKLSHLPTQLLELQLSLARLRRSEQLPPSKCNRP